MVREVGGRAMLGLYWLSCQVSNDGSEPLSKFILFSFISSI